MGRLTTAALALCFAALSAIAPASNALASTRPKTGGILRVQISERVENLDPRQSPPTPEFATALERIDSLVFDRLLRLDERGELQPALALSWQYDAKDKCWQFRLRAGVEFSDGAPLTPPIAAMALQQLLGVSFDVSANADSVLVRGDQLPTDLPLHLATGRYFIFHAGDEGQLAGTGPFQFASVLVSGRNMVFFFNANETCWAGRPYVDKILLRVGVSGDQQADAIAFGQADVVELPPSQVRRAAQRGVRTTSSEPVELFALLMEGARPAIQDSRVRQAISLGIDRASVANVILQGQGVVAADLLPNWISGYAHLFTASFDLPRAKDLLAASGYQLSRSAPLVLVYDSTDPEAHAVADRVAVNLRELGLTVQVSGQVSKDAMDGKAKASGSDMRLVRQRIEAPFAAPALSALLESLGERAQSMEALEAVHDAERGLLDTFRVIPLVHVSESYGLSPQVRDWTSPRWGGWNLADVWLDQPSPAENSKVGSPAP